MTVKLSQELATLERCIGPAQLPNRLRRLSYRIEARVVEYFDNRGPKNYRGQSSVLLTVCTKICNCIFEDILMYFITKRFNVLHKFCEAPKYCFLVLYKLADST